VVLVAYGLTALAFAVLSLEPPYATPLWPIVALAVGGVGVWVLRRRHPDIAFAGALTLCLISLTVGTGAEALLAVIAMFEVGVRRRAASTWLFFGTAMLVGALGALALSLRGSVGPYILGLQPPMTPRDTLVDWANTFLIISVVLLLATLLGTNVGHRRRYIGALEDRADQLARERDQQAETARARERERIAREMHDVIAHSLSVMIAISDGAHAAVDESPKQAKEAIGRVAETGRKTLGEVRRLLGTVRADSGAEHAPQPDARQLAALVQEFIAAGLPVHLMVKGEPTSDPALGLTVYRIVQESLTNALRHARHVTSVDVTVSWADDQITIVVEDESSASERSQTPGRGLLGMQERAALYDGDIQAGPYERGWRVVAHLQKEDR
jgi:signal transduction histidine kinase